MKNTHYTSDHFRRMFKKETGKTPTAYLLDLRVKPCENAAKTKK